VLPWELLRPARRGSKGEREERDFLGMEFQVARWHVGESLVQLERPPQFSVWHTFITAIPILNFCRRRMRLEILPSKEL